MKTASEIVELLGGPGFVAQAMGLPYTTVHSWTRWNAIPAWRHDALVRIAGKQKKALKVEDFPVPAARTKKARAA